MDGKRTRGGKRKLTFAPKVPSPSTEGLEDLEEAEGLDTLQSEEPKEEAKPEEGPVIKTGPQHTPRNKKEMPIQHAGLSGDMKEASTPFIKENTPELFLEDLEKAEDSPRTAESILRREVVYTDTLSPKEFKQEQRYLLQLPRIIPEHGGRYLQGKLRISPSGEATLVLRGKPVFGTESQEITFSLAVSKTPVLQEVFRKNEEAQAYTNEGRLSAKIISRASLASL
ncbi:hypothetical protein NECID01_0908 [Nematocida sp. AWRm77]|nr:hypothetical protein NECID01_0908 [Nematocida sp. AWRm77]